MKSFIVVIAVAISGIVFILLGYGAWLLERELNYTFSYGSQVEETVCKMVKPEYLIDQNICKNRR